MVVAEQLVQQVQSFSTDQVLVLTVNKLLPALAGVSREEDKVCVCVCVRERERAQLSLKNCNNSNLTILFGWRNTNLVWI